MEHPRPFTVAEAPLLELDLARVITGEVVTSTTAVDPVAGTPVEHTVSNAALTTRPRGAPGPAAFKLWALCLRWLDAEDEALGSLHASQNHESVDVVRVVIVEDSACCGKGVARRLEDAGFELVARTATRMTCSAGARTQPDGQLPPFIGRERRQDP